MASLPGTGNDENANRTGALWDGVQKKSNRCKGDPQNKQVDVLERANSGPFS